MAITNILKDNMVDFADIERLYNNRRKYSASKVILQRGNMWTYEQKSNLIESIFLNISISTITVNNRNGEYRIIDGNHRFLAITKFINNEYHLTGIKENIIVNLSVDKEMEYDLNGKYFSDLPFELQQIFLKKRIQIMILDNLNEKEEAEYILRMNSGTSMSGISKARVESYDLVTPFILEMKEHPLFKLKLKVSKLRRERFLDESLINVIIAYECGVDDIKITDYEKVNKAIRERGLMTEDIKDRIKNKVDYLNSIIPSVQTWVNVQNLIVLYMCVDELKGMGLSRMEMDSSLKTFFNNVGEEYASGGWSSKAAINRRKNILINWMDRQWRR